MADALIRTYRRKPGLAVLDLVFADSTVPSYTLGFDANFDGPFADTVTVVRGGDYVAPESRQASATLSLGRTAPLTSRVLIDPTSMGFVDGAPFWVQATPSGGSVEAAHLVLPVSSGLPRDAVTISGDFPTGADQSEATKIVFPSMTDFSILNTSGNNAALTIGDGPEIILVPHETYSSAFSTISTVLVRGVGGTTTLVIAGTRPFGLR